MRVHFVARALASEWPDLDDLNENDVDAQATRFRGASTTQRSRPTLRLKSSLASAGIAATIGRRWFPCVNVAHRDCLNLADAVLSQLRRGIRADRPPVFLCNVEVVQNDLQPKTARTAFLNSAQPA